MSKPSFEDKAAGGDPAAKLQLAQALWRARLAIGWERFWPHLARVATLAGLFLCVSWLGTWLVLPFVGRAIGLAIFAVLTIAALVPALWFRWPTRADALVRLDRGSGVRHRPATALTDTLASQDPVARALWQAQRERTLASIKRIRAGLPTPRLSLQDPWAVRGFVIVLLAATFIAASGERTERVLAAFDLNGMLAGANVRLDAWVTPPSYTGRPPMILLGGANNSVASSDAAIAVPAGSILVVRASGGSLNVAIGGGVSDAGAGDKPPPLGTEEKRFTIAADGTAQVRSPSGHPKWQFTAAADKAPEISLAKDPERQARGALLLSYKLVDDFGVAEARAHFAVRSSGMAAKTSGPGAPDSNSSGAARPLFDPPDYQLVLPNARTRNGVGQTVKDLTEHPFAGAEMTLTLSAKDEAGNEGHSAPFEMRLPERLFAKPLSRSLIEQRRLLALDAGKAPLVRAALDGLLIAPEMFTPEMGQYLGLRDIAAQLDQAKSDNALREVVASLWALAVLIEDGDINDVDKALRAAQDALRQALDRGASDEEIKKLTDQLRAAMDKFLRQFAEQSKNNPQQLARPLDKNARVLSEQDLKNMLDRLERLARSGDRDAARQLLDQLAQMMENLQMAQPGQGDNDMERSMNELSDVIRKQQQLRDRTFKQGQDSRRDRMRGERGNENAMNDLQRDQQGLRDRLKKLLDQLAKDGMMPQPGDQQGQGDDADQDQADSGDNGLNDADQAMGDAGGKLGEGDADSAVDSQGQALEALRKGARKLAQQMQQNGDDDGQGPGNRVGRRQGGPDRTDPLGREVSRRDLDTDPSVKIPGEIDVQRARRVLEELRKRLGESLRPQIELDYIERLLKDY